ncbi:hypothetical protein [Entomohabitans teleogrylli]|uniref:hypothetical protein n=1 Tax=Entomohabitans teleogrylli TaxID=1384589 RepID=UPI00073D3401|nr:hypothetical protein [Entomohabitans teleogrylli]
MTKNNAIIVKQFLIFLLLAALTGLISSFVLIDVLWLESGVREISLTEISQELFLLITAALYLRCAIKREEIRGGLLLIAGFYATLFIRELDYWFDFIQHGAWLWFALSATGLALFAAWKARDSVARGLATFILHPGFAYTLCGLVTVLIFSRVFGMTMLWETLLNDGYANIVKTSIEEGTELLGYTLCLFSACYFSLAPQPAAVAEQHFVAGVISGRQKESYHWK